MKNGVWKCALVLSCVLALSVPASATVLTFEDLDPGYASYGPVPANYAGFTWGGPNGTYWITEDFYPASGYHNTLTMVPNSRMGIFTPWATEISMSDGAFRLTSVNVGAAWDTGGEDVRFDGYLNGGLVASETFLAPYEGMTKTFSWGMIDTLKVTPGGGNQICLDNMDFTPAPGLPAFALVSAAPILGGLLRRFRRK